MGRGGIVPFYDSGVRHACAAFDTLLFDVVAPVTGA